MMDPLSQARFNEVTSKTVLDLTEEDIAFLRARAPYLSGDQKEVFAEVLTVPEPEATDTEEPKKKAAK